MTPFDGDEAITPFEWLTSSSSLGEVLNALRVVNKRAIHVGSGTSTAGQLLVEEFAYDLVLDVDKEEKTLDGMKQHWQRRCEETGEDQSKLQHLLVDLTRASIEEAEEASFGLVLDKATLDCTLCGDDATAALLVEVYRCLAAGGTYVLISFHAKDFLLPILRDLPGAEWEISCQTMARHTERLDHSRPNASNDKANMDTDNPHQGHHHPPLNVFVVEKSRTASHHILSMNQAREHVHSVSDKWFQQWHPLLTHQRQQQLLASFSKPLPLSEAYFHLFTEAEREHLEYEHFLEDWEAFIEQWKGKNSGFVEDSSTVTYEMACEFLNEMQ